MNARRVGVGNGEGAKEPAAVCCERLVAYQVHGVQQEVLHHAVPRAGAVVAVTKQMGMRVARSNSMGVSVLRARNVDHALRIWSSPSNAGAHSAMRNGLRLSTVPA